MDERGGGYGPDMVNQTASLGERLGCGGLGIVVGAVGVHVALQRKSQSMSGGEPVACW